VTTYHHGHLREALTATAYELARTDGPDGVVLREVARRTGVSHNAAYRHFADRDELLSDVAGLAMDQLAQAMLTRIGAITDGSPEQRAWRHLAATGRAYVEFALAEPGLFAIAFAGHEPADHEGEPDPAAPGPYDVLGGVLDELVAVGEIAPADREGADLYCWAAVHGFALLHLGGPLAAEPPAARAEALERLLATIARGLGAPADPTLQES
jgi:AcrR family transcriptional regulator